MDKRKVKLTEYRLHGTWDHGRFTHDCIAQNQMIAEEQFRESAPLHPSAQINEFEVIRMFDAWIAENL